MAKLGSICEVLNGYAFKSEKYVNDGIRVIRITNVQKGYIEDSDPKYYPIEYLNDLLKYVLESGDLLVSLTGNVGRVGILPEDFLPAALNQRVACLRLTNNQYLKSFLFHVLNSDYFEEKCINASKGIAQKNLSTEWLKDFDVPDYSISEQRQIAEMLDKVTRLIDLYNTILDRLDLLVKSRFVEMFGDFKSNSKSWKIAQFTDIAIIDGHMTTDYVRYADYPHIGIDSIEKDTGDLRGYRTVAEDCVVSGKYIFTPKHIIYSKIRPNLNKVALPNFDGLCSADSYPILPIEDVCDRIFLAYNMRSKFFLDYILKFCSRTNLPKVNRKELSGFTTPLPPIELQKQFSAFVEQTDKSKLAVKQMLDKAETLKKALMQEYFG